ncbi:MAG TPA: hypothetical protein VMU85_01335 [Stellaceae bacterium]|nr:hypothetical protein [Stellaceae bacterium]
MRTLVAAIALPLLAAMPAAAQAPAAQTFVIDLTYESEMDMVRPEVMPHLHVHHNLHLTIARGGALSESRDRSVRRYADQNGMVQVLGSSGDEARYASWKAAPDGTLVRVQHDPQSTRTMTVTLLPDSACRLEVVDKLDPGFTEYEFLRVSTHTMAFFSSYRVIATSCRIHS